MAFKKRYKVYLDTSVNSDWWWNEDTLANWVEIHPDILSPKYARSDGEYFHRFEWDEVTFRNNPAIDEMLYDTLSVLSLTQEIRIRIITESNVVIRGFFGLTDCSFDYDQKVITVTPYTLDRYTLILENDNEDINATGGYNDYEGTFYQACEDDDKFYDSHNVPLNTTTVYITEAQDVDTDATPLNGGAFIANTKYQYNALFEFDVNVDYTNPSNTPGTFSFYIRAYDSSGVLIIEELLESFIINAYVTEEYTYVGNVYNSYSRQLTIPQYSYITLECDISHALGTAFISYSSLELRASLVSTPLDSISVDVSLNSDYLVSLVVWSNGDDHGRATPKASDWATTNGVLDYFDQETGEPIVDGRFADNSYGPKSARGTINNGKDIETDIDTEDLKLDNLVELLDGYEYELSDVTVYKGSQYTYTK